MDTAKVTKVYKNFVIILDEQGIRRLYDEIYKLLGEETGESKNISFEISYLDGSSIRTTYLEKLVEDENLTGREIKTVKMLGVSPTKRISIIFGTIKENMQGGILLGISGPTRQWTYVAQSVIEERIGALKESRRRNGYYIASVLIAVPLLTMLFSGWLKKYLPPIYIQDGNTRNYGWGFAILLFADIALIWMLIWAILKLFPNLVFLIGKEIDRHKKRLQIRTNIFWVVFIGTLVSVTLIFINRVFFQK